MKTLQEEKAQKCYVSVHPSSRRTYNTAHTFFFCQADVICPPDPITTVNTAIHKPRPNDRNTPTQHIATLLGATCCVRLATVLRSVATCWLLLAQI